jgi:hypothetical protein
MQAKVKVKSGRKEMRFQGNHVISNQNQNSTQLNSNSARPGTLVVGLIK